MKKLLLPILTILTLLGGCLTTDYNLRAVVDPNRFYQGVASDSTSTNMKWNTPSWRAKNVKYWRSAGVIVTNSYNAFTENGWLKQIVADGFEGTVYVKDEAMDYIQFSFLSKSPWSNATSFQRESYTAKIRAYSTTNGHIMAYPALNYPYFFSNSSLIPYTSDIISIVSPTGWQDSELQTRYISAWNSATARATISINDTNDHVKWGVMLDDYSLNTWEAIDNSGAVPSNLSVDNIRAWSTNTANQKETLISAMQTTKLKMFHNANISVIVRGDKLTTELDSNEDLAVDLIDGVIFEDVNPTNISQFETDLAAIRSMKPINTVNDALLVIAGVKNDVYHASSPTVYAQLIQRLVADGVYFTPGGNGSLWNMPSTNPGAWWVRSNNDRNWQAQAPTYSTPRNSPRKILGAIETLPYNEISEPLGFGGGGWLESGDFHPTNPNKVMLGADVVNCYYSEDNGETFNVVTKGGNDREDYSHYYAAGTLGISNSEFSGFFQATNGGIFSFSIDGADTLVSMTPYNSSTGMYISEVSMGLTNPWGYWVEPIPFSDLAKTKDENYIVASSGKYRWEGDSNHGDIHYPSNYVTVNYANPVGRQGLWYYNFNESSETRKWRPVETVYDALNKDHGMYRSIDVSIAGTDTIIVAASSMAGPQMLNVKTKRWTDLGSFPFHSHNGTTVTPTWGKLSTTTNNTQTVESIYLTDRMTAYVCVVNKDGAWAGKSGLYRMHNVMFPTSWEWVGDQTVMPFVKFTDLTPRPIDQFANGGGIENESTFNYVNVAEGSSSQPDTVYVATRSGNAGLSRIIVPYGEGTSYNQKQTWEPKLWLYSYRYTVKRMPEASFPVDAYNDKMHWNGITFEPMINPKNANEVIVQDNVVLVKTIDGGTSWTNIEPTKPVSTDLTLNSNSGYIETCTNDIAVLSDGRLAVSNADIGLGISRSASDWSTFDNVSSKITILSSYNTSTCDNDLSGLKAEYANYGLSTDLNDDLISWSYETSSIHVEPNWNGTGRDAVFMDTGKRVGDQGMSNIIMYHDSNGDGTWEATGVTTKTLNPTRYKYGYYYGIAWVRDANNLSFYAPYKKATTSACDVTTSGVVWENFGVHKWSYNSTTNSWSGPVEISTFNDFDYGDASYTTHRSDNQPVGHPCQAHDIVYCAAQHKLYMAVEYYTTGTGSRGVGGVYELDLDDATPTWVAILGKNSFSTTPSDGRNYATDPMNLELSSDGSTLYVLTRGEETGRSGIWKVTNLNNTVMSGGNPTWNLPNIEWVLNNPDNETAFVPMPPSRYGEILTDRQRLKNTTGLTIPLDYSFDAFGKGLLINPLNSDQIWFTTWARTPQNPDGGLWAYDTSRNILKHVLDQDSGDRVVYTDENLYYDSYHTPNRLVMGTDCTGVYYINYDGVFHTDRESTTKPLPTSYISHEYSPTGVYTINGDSKVTVVWNSIPNYNKNGFAGYNVLRSTTLNGTYTTLNGSPLTPTWSDTNHFSYDDATAVNGSTYYYKVAATYSGGIGGTDPSIAVKGSPRQNYILTHSTEDFWGHSTATAWSFNSGLNEISTYNPFGGAYDQTSAQGVVCVAGASTFAQMSTPTYQTAQNKNWMLVSAYVKANDASLAAHNTATLRVYKRTATAGPQAEFDWTWTSDPKVITVTSSIGSGSSQADGQGSYYVGNGWTRIWWKQNLNSRSTKTMDYTIHLFPFNANNTVGYGMYMWGLMVEYSDTEPTTLCDYIPVRPITSCVPSPPRYWGDENCVTLSMTAPSTPTGLSVSDYTSSSISLGWNASAGTSYYNIARSQTTETETPLTTSSTTSLTDPTVRKYEPYYYKVNAVNSDLAASSYSSEVSYYANDWTHGTTECSESTPLIFNPPDFHAITDASDSGMVDFSFVYDDATSLYHIIGIDGQLLLWWNYNNTTTPNATQFVHYTSSDLVNWTRKPNIPLYDSTYATTNVWAPHIVKYGSTWYMFYTGVVQGPSGRENIDNIQRIMLSTSTDLYTWTTGTVVLNGNDYDSGVTAFANWTTTLPHTNFGYGDLRDPCVIRNEADNGWLMFVSMNGISGQVGDGGMVIAIARSTNLTGPWKLYDFVRQTSTPTSIPASSTPGAGYDYGYGAYSESPYIWVNNGIYYLSVSTNDWQKAIVSTSTTPSEGWKTDTSSWSSVNLSLQYKAPEILRLETGEYIMSFLESQTWDSEYFHVGFRRFFMMPDGTNKISYIAKPSCFTGSGAMISTIVAGEFLGDPPVADFSSNVTSGTTPLTVQFSDLSTNSPTTWSWNFGDTGTASTKNPSHTYSNSGTYTVSLTATNIYGNNTKTKTSYITVSTPVSIPVASYSATPTSGTVPLTVTFTDESTNTPTSWLWYFGDGATSTSQNPTHIYTIASNLSPVLLATNSAGTNGFGRTNYIVASDPIPTPTADFTGIPVSGTIPFDVSFTSSSSGALLTYGWSFGDGGTSTAQNPTHSYTVAGTYTVSLTVVNGGGSNTKTRTAYIVALPPAPVASFTGIPLTGNAPLTVNFTDASTNTPTSWSWNFGDSGTSTSRNPSHVYSVDGTYTVAMTATNGGGSNTQTRTSYVTVLPSVPVVAFSGTPLSGSIPLTVNFTDASTNSPTSWAWNFGDGGTSTSQNPSHVYSAAGTYSVVLTATNSGGSGSLTKTSYVTTSESSGTPSITGMSGTFINGNTITINGSGFGVKSPAPPLVWEKCEGHTNQSLVTTNSENNPPATGAWAYHSPENLGEYQFAVWSSTWSHSGSGSISNERSIGRTGRMAFIYPWGVTPTTRIYMTQWTKTSDVGATSSGSTGGGGALKWNRINSSSHAGGGGRYNELGEHIFFFGSSGYDNSQWSEGNMRNMWKDGTLSPEQGFIYDTAGGMRMEAYVKISTPGGSDGVSWSSIIGSPYYPLVTYTGIDRLAGETWLIDTPLFGVGVENQALGGQQKFFMDDLYADNTQARIEIGNNQSFWSCTHREIQIPVTWSSTSITATVNTGSFMSGGVWMFIVDENGVASVGYPITIPAENYYENPNILNP